MLVKEQGRLRKKVRLELKTAIIRTRTAQKTTNNMLSILGHDSETDSMDDDDDDDGADDVDDDDDGDDEVSNLYA